MYRNETGETFATKIEYVFLKTDSFLKENQLTLNADKTELLPISTRDEIELKVTFNEMSIKFPENCRFLGTQLDSKIIFGFFENMAAAIRSL